MARAVSKKRTSKAAAKKGATRKAPARRPSRPRGFKLCIDFGLFPDDTVLGPSFSLAGFAFSQVAGADMVVNITEGEKGLGFPDQGMRVAPPTAVSSVSMRIGLLQVRSRSSQETLREIRLLRKARRSTPLATFR